MHRGISGTSGDAAAMRRILCRALLEKLAAVCSSLFCKVVNWLECSSGNGPALRLVGAAPLVSSGSR